MTLSAFNFSLPEMLSLLGLAQCVYILVYMLFRSGRLSRGALPALYFFILGTAFLFDAAQRSWAPLIQGYEHWQWLFWFSGPPLSTLLVIQVARITRIPAVSDIAILLLIPAAYFASLLLSAVFSDCYSFIGCEMTGQLLVISGLIVCALSLLTIWIKRGLLNNLHAQKSGRERFWLIMALIFLNTAFLTAIAALAYGMIDEGQATLLRNVLGIAFAYTASTSLFRIYPQAVRVKSRSGSDEDTLSDAEIELAMKLERLLRFEKVYQEPSYGRSDLARELSITEAALSRIVNLYFGKGVPQLLNEHRVGDAERLLKETDAGISTVSSEAGFNSVATFNRVFKELSGVAPSDFRKLHRLGK